ncbi:translation elongation factor Ts [Candidatus Termititenax persephonae]|uniref:Elongation factor Ts n=1 Tax=Candidatus Termititenax persephonae TaxID=2218525 RepID=A0A388TG27_9BACT|nr:translation elongation factor Ts [Candidatus Termititenax persephonae]
MVEISAAAVKELREKTQAGMMDCKKALQETAGNFDAAIKWLREKGLSAAAKRSDRAASEGLIDVKFNDDRTAAVVFELNSETDFVARNDKFRSLLNQLLDQTLARQPKDIAELETQTFIGDESKKVADLITDAIAVIGENIIARRFALFQADSGNLLESYVHNGRIGVLVELAGQPDSELAKNIAMHIAAANPAPQYLDRLAVSPEHLQSEQDIYRTQILQDEKNTNKPANIIEKIIDGKVNKFYQDVCLLEQAYIRDPDKTIKDILPAGVSITRFARLELGA